MADILSIFRVVLFSVVGILGASVLCIYFFGLTDVLSYRLVVIFLSLILISNFISGQFVDYFENKK